MSTQCHTIAGVQVSISLGGTTQRIGLADFFSTCRLRDWSLAGPTVHRRGGPAEERMHGSEVTFGRCVPRVQASRCSRCDAGVLKPPACVCRGISADVSSGIFTLDTKVVTSVERISRGRQRCPASVAGPRLCPSEFAEAVVNRFLTHPALRGKVPAPMQNVALAFATGSASCFCPLAARAFSRKQGGL